VNQENEPIENPEGSSAPKEEMSTASAPGQAPVPSKKAKPVIFYIVIMFAVALFLIILSFLMQQRNHEVLLKGLSSSSLHVQNLVDLEMDKNKLEDTLTETLTELETVKADKKTQEEAATRQTQAMEYLMEVRLAYSAGKHSHARELLAEMQKQKLNEALPEASSLPDTKSPRTHYQELVDALN